MTVRPSSSRPRCGFTLLEAVFSTGLVLLVLILMGNFFSQLQRGQKTREKNEQAAQAQQTAFNVLSSDIRAAVKWNTASGGNLDFCVPDYLHPAYLPLTPEPLPTPAWNPVSHVLRVRYRVQNRQLLREVASGANFQPVLVLDDVDNFSVRRPSPQEMEVTLVLPGLRTQRTLTRRVDLPIQAIWGQP